MKKQDTIKALRQGTRTDLRDNGCSSMIEDRDAAFDNDAVYQFARMMKDKMEKSRAKGRSGWKDPAQCSPDYLRALLYEHIYKGDPVDVANICMMLRHYDEKTTPRPNDNLMLPVNREACERIADMLEGDDGEAWFEAEKFLKRHAPDLYDEIGMPGEPLPDFPEPSLLDKMQGALVAAVVGLLAKKPRK